MTKIKNIIFDWSGVINDNTEDVYNVICDMFSELGGRKISFEEFRRNWEAPYMIFYHKYFPTLTKEKQDDLYKKYYTKHHRQRLFPGAKELLTKLGNLGLQMTALTSDHPQHFLDDLKKYGMENVFVKVYPGVHDKSKQIERILSECNFDPATTAIVGDSIDEVKIGKTHNLTTISVTWGFNLEEQLRDVCPNFIARNIKELEDIILEK